MLNDYQKEAARKFKDHHSLQRMQARLLNWAVGLSGETGEVSELIKHQIFAEEEIDKMELAKELGDVLWYLSAIATTEDIKMEDIAALNLAKLNHRYYTGAYTDGEAQTRHEREALFTDTPLYKTIKARIMKTAMPTSIIFVGPDGAGKTTIARDVATRLHLQYHKCDYRQDDKQAVGQELLAQNTNTVYDRFYWPDEMIYCNAKNIQQTAEYWKAFIPLINSLRNLNILYIYITASKEELLKRSANWADDYVKTEHLDPVISGYEDWITSGIVPTNHPILSYDTTGISVNSPEYIKLLDDCCARIKLVMAPQED